MNSRPAALLPTSARWALILLLSLLAVAFATAARSAEAENAESQDAAPKKPGLWQRLKTDGIRVQVGRDGVTTGPADKAGTGSAQRSGAPFDAAAVYRGDSDQPLYTSLGGAGRLGGLYANDDPEKRQKGLLEWPRAAVTFTKYGPALACWEGTARIWSSANAHADETFRLCNAPSVVPDAFGRPGTISWQVISSYASQLRSAPVLSGHTGAQRTLGPKPPQKPFGLPTVTLRQPGGHIPAVDPLNIRLETMLVRLAWATGYLPVEEMEGLAGSGFAKFGDARLWVVGFDPAGLQQ